MFSFEVLEDDKRKLDIDLIMPAKQQKSPLIRLPIKILNIGSRGEDVTVTPKSGKYKGKT